MCCRSPARPSETSIAACAGPRRRSPSSRRGSHGGEIREIDGERLVAKGARRGAGGEVAAFNQHVGGERELEAGVGAHERAVVADAEERARRATGKETADELEFGQAAQLC